MIPCRYGVNLFRPVVYVFFSFPPIYTHTHTHARTHAQTHTHTHTHIYIYIYMQFCPKDELSFCEQVAVRRADTCEAWRGLFGGAPSIINFNRSIQSSPTGNHKVVCPHLVLRCGDELNMCNSLCPHLVLRCGDALHVWSSGAEMN